MKIPLMKLAAATLLSISLDSPIEVNILLKNASMSFMEYKVKESIDLFEKAIELNPAVRESLWQYGLSLYVDGRYSDCANQFQLDYAKNPDDTEEVVWDYLCERRNGLDEKLALGNMPVKREDPRPVMGLIERAYRKGDMSLLENMIRKYESAGDVEKVKKTLLDERDYFYSLLYLGLHQEANGYDEESTMSIQKAATSLYGREASRDYMTTVAKVLLKRP